MYDASICVLCSSGNAGMMVFARTKKRNNGKEMVENNNGTIWVESTLNQGTSFYFTVPKAIKENGKASYIKSSKLSTAT